MSAIVRFKYMVDINSKLIFSVLDRYYFFHRIQLINKRTLFYLALPFRDHYCDQGY